MKYIQKFESNKDDEYYTLLDHETYGDPRDSTHDAINMDRDEYNKISKLYPYGYKCQYKEEYVDVGGEDNISIRDVFILKAVNVERRSIQRIYKLEDEWYILSVSDLKDLGTIFFKVDQFDGLKYIINKLSGRTKREEDERKEKLRLFNLNRFNRT